MRKKPYYSLRTGKNPLSKGVDLPLLRTLFHDIHVRYEDAGYFQEHFGYGCVDQGHVPGRLGSNIPAQLRLKLRKENIWPINEHFEAYTEDDLFDMIEFLHDHISKPIEGWHHDFSDCGMHYQSFDKTSGQDEYRDDINEILRDYDSGYAISPDGEILHAVESGFENLFKAELPESNRSAIEGRVNSAISKFRRYKATLDDRRDAIRDLADALESIRPKLKAVLTSKDESDLFHLANAFGIRHHNSKQKAAYDQSVWYSWMFYYYLATIHASLRLLERTGGQSRA